MSERHCPRCGGTKIQMHWCDGGGLAHTCERCNERWGDDLPRFDKVLVAVLERERAAKVPPLSPIDGFRFLVSDTGAITILPR